MLVESLFKTKTSQREIAKHAHCSIPQIKKMKKIYHAFGTTVAPKIMERGRPRALTQEMVDICSISINSC